MWGQTKIFVHLWTIMSLTWNILQDEVEDDFEEGDAFLDLSEVKDLGIKEVIFCDVDHVTSHDAHRGLLQAS